MKSTKNSRDMSKWFLEIFDCEELRHLPEAVLDKILENDTKIYEEYIKEYPDLKDDTLREFFETYFSDREFLAQDFTPSGLSMLLTELALAGECEPPKEMLDECAGIGSLIIPYWLHNPDVMVYAREISSGTIPFLLFNLAVRNMQGVVVQGDTLTLETFNVYVLNKGEEFSTVQKFDLNEEIKRLDPIFLMKALMAYYPERFEYKER